MFSSLKDRLNSAVSSSGISPKPEEISPDESEELPSTEKKEMGENSLETKGTEGVEDKKETLISPPSSNSSKHKFELKGQAQTHPLAENGTATTESIDKKKETVSENSDSTNLLMSEELAKKLEKLKKYEVKYPELARAYKFQMGKLKSLDAILQTLTPVQSYTDSEGLEEYLKNLVSQSEMAMSEFKKVSELNNKSNQQLQETQKKLDSALAQVQELEASKLNETSSKPESEFDISQVEQLQKKLNELIEDSFLESQRAEISELISVARKSIGEESDLVPASELKETQVKLDTASSELDDLREQHEAKVKQLDSDKEKIKELQTFKLQVATLTKQYEESNKKYNELSKVFVEFSEKNLNSSTHQDILKSVSARFKEITTEKEKAEKKAEVQNNIVKSLRSSLDGKTSQVTTLSEELDALKMQGNVAKNGDEQSVSNPPSSNNGKQESAAQRKKKKKKNGANQNNVQPQPPTPTPSSPSTPSLNSSQSLESRLETSKSECSRLQQVIDEQTNELNNLNESLQLANKNLQESAEKESSLKEQLNKVVASEKEISDNLKDLSDQFKAKSQDLDVQSKELNKLKKEHVDLTKARNEALEQLNTLKDEESRLKDFIEKQNSELKTHQEQAKDASKAETLKAEISKLELQCKDVNKHLEEARKESAQRQATVTRLTKKINELESDVKAKDSALTFSKRQNAQLEHEKKDMESELLSQQRQIKALNTLTKKKDEELSNLSVELTQIKEENSNYSSSVSNSNESIGKLQNEINNLNESLTEKAKSVDELNANNEKCRKEAEESIQKRDAAQKELKDQVQELESLKNELKDMKERCEIINQDLATSKKLFKEKAGNLDALHLQHVKLQETSAEELSQLKEELLTSKNKMSQLEKELDTIKKSTEADISSLKTQLEKVTQELNSASETLKQIESQNVSLLEEKKQLESKQSDSLSKAEALELKLQEAQEKMSIQLTSLKESLNATEKELCDIKLERDTLSEQSKLRESHLRNLNRDLKEEVKRLQRTTSGVSFGGSPPMSPIDTRSLSDLQDNDDPSGFNLEYLRNVILKFLSDRDRRPQLVTVLTHLLKFNSSDTRKLMDAVHL